MASLVWCTGFEHGLAALSISGLGLFNNITGTAIAVNATAKRTGSYGLQINPTATITYVSKNMPGTPTYVVGRVYLKWPTLPNAKTTIIHMPHASATFRIYYVQATGLLSARVGSGTEIAGAAIVANTWYRIDYRFYCGGTTWTIDWSVATADAAGVAQTQATEGSHSASTFSAVGTRIGTAEANTMDMYVDDLVYSVTDTDYPIGPGGVIGLRPNADGAHNNAAGYMQDGAGHDINGTTYFAFNKLDENPWVLTPAVDYVVELIDTVPNTYYCEVLFEDTTYNVIHGVQAVLQYSSATASANAAKTYILDSDAQVTTLYSGDMSEITSFYKSVQVLTPAGGWTKDYVNSLRSRFGYATDATPDPYWQALILEVAYQAVITLVPQEANQTQGEDTPALTQHHILVTAELAQIQAEDTPALTQHHVLAGAELAQTEGIDNAVITVHEGALQLVAQENAQVQAIDVAAITQVHGLAAQESAQAQAEDTAAITQVHSLLAQENAQTQAEDTPALVQIHSLGVQENAQVQVEDMPAITQNIGVGAFKLKPESPAIDAGIDVGLTQDFEGGAVPAGAAPEMGAFEFPALTPAENYQAQAIDSPALTQDHHLVANENAQTQGIDQTNLSGVVTLSPAENAQTQISDTPALVQKHVLVSSELAETQGIDGAILTQVHKILTSELAQGQVIDSAILAQLHKFVAQECAQTQGIDLAMITVHLGAVLSPDENFQIQISDSAILALIYKLNVGEIAQVQAGDLASLYQIAKVGVDELEWYMNGLRHRGRIAKEQHSGTGSLRLGTKEKHLGLKEVRLGTKQRSIRWQ